MIRTPVAAELRALGTTARVVVDGPSVDTARALLEEELDRIDRTCSRFRDDSDLSLVNDAAGHAVVVDPLLIDAIDVARRAARVTDGLVDPTVGVAVRVLGYDRDFSRLEPDGPPLVVRAARVPGWRAIEVDRTRSTVRIPSGVLLDLGATAKAFCADRAADRIAREIGRGVLVALGGDVAIAGEPPAGGWSVRVADHHATPFEGPGETVALWSGGLATSSTTVRTWRRGEETYHHVVDPATGRSADGSFRTVTVAAGSCVDANIATTAAIVLGDAAPSWLEARHLPARLVTRDGAVVHIGGWGGEAS